MQITDLSQSDKSEKSDKNSCHERRFAHAPAIPHTSTPTSVFFHEKHFCGFLFHDFWCI